MVHYKLEYFTVRGLGEPARQLFVLAGVEYENIALDLKGEEWQKLKPNTPFGHLPVLTVDGVAIAESAAIARFLARRFGFAGKTPVEEAWADVIVDQFKEFFSSFIKVFVAQSTNKPVDEIEKLKKEVYEPAKIEYFKNLNKILEKSKSGFLVGSDVTFADLFVVENLTTLEQNGFLNFADEPKLAALHKKVTSIPALKAWIEKRPHSAI